MYIDKIDDLIDKIIDDFYATVILKDSKIVLFVKEINFVKYQSDINDILKKYISNLNLSELKSIVSNNDIINKIIDVIKKYITLYLFLYIGFYNDNNTGFANNIVEFTKNQASYGFKISGFFNSESNGIIIDLYSLIQKIQKLLNAETKQKRELLVSKIDYKQVVLFLNNLGGNFVNASFNVDDKNHIRAHNIIKTIIIVSIYKLQEKIDLFRILELLETTDNEFTFIDIVVPIKEFIEISTIEGLLSKKEIIRGTANKIWNAIEELEEEEKIYIKTPEEKILYLINCELLVPIVDDILLYNNINELYDRSVGEENKLKKREDTKIRYIINKIELATNINQPEYHNEAKKIFYQPLINRKIVLVNNIEDIKIINKFINIGKISTENTEYLHDLEHLIIYPYINIKELKNGLYMQMNKTIDVLRYVNFENSSEFKQRPNTYLDTRVGTQNMYLNIVGFMINTENSLYCIRNKELQSVNFNKHTENGYTHTTEKLNEILMEKKNKENLFWIFNQEKDKINISSYEQQNKLTNYDQIKHIVANIYDNFEQKMYEHIIHKIKELKEPILTKINKIIYDLFKKYFSIEKKSLLLDLEKKIYTELIKRGKIIYDKLDDIVNGISKDNIILPDFKQIQKNIKNIVKIDLTELTEEGIYEDKDVIQGVCQHNITWDKISGIKKNNPKLFLDILYRFIQQYVVENPEGEYICKSCGFFLNIKKYVADGTFDDDHHFISFSMILETPLEDIPEYEKYKGSIRSIDKFIEKISSVTGIPYFVGSNPTVKSRRKLVVKDVIDIVINNNFILKKILKDRIELSTKLYGINKNYSNIFSFDLDNSIFIFSSKDKDYLKPIKQNNVLAYIIILVMLELNESQITHFNNDKKGFCNFVVFDTVYYSLFDGLKIRKNNKGDTVNIANYEIFCYMLYMISCNCTKYNLWYYDYKDAADDKTKKQKLLPTIQKIIIHTVIDILNSIIENSEDDKNKHRIFEILKTKFYKKINSTFSNKSLYERMLEDNKILTNGDKKSIIVTKDSAFLLNGKYNTSFDKIDFWRKIKTHMMYLDIKPRQIEKYDSINNVTNCDSGDFHNFVYDNKTLKCTKCNKLTSQLKLDKSTTKTIKNKFHMFELTNLSKKYCFIDGNFHEFNHDKNNKKICEKCNKDETYVFKENELEKLYYKFIENKSNKYKNIENIIVTNTEKEKKYKVYIEELKTKVKSDYIKTPTYIEDLIKNMEDNISEELIKNINSLRNNLYIFDHDYLGTLFDKEIHISEKDNKIQFKSNHPFFNKDVIYYTTYKSGKIDVFYDAITKILIGYKEENKNFVSNIHTGKKIRILYSTTNKLRMLGYKYKNYNIDVDVDVDLFKDNDLFKDIDKEQSIKHIIINKINTVSQIIYRFQRLIYRLINNSFTKKKVDEYEKINEEYNFFNNKYEQLIENYGKKLRNINIVNTEGNHLILRHWKNIADNLQYNQNNNIDIDINTNTIDYEKISKYDNYGVLLNFYLINEINKLYKYNSNKQIKINISAFIYDFINITFSLTNEEKTQSDKDYKRFKYILNSKIFIDEIKDQIGNTEGIYEEVVDENKETMTEDEQNKIDDDVEENDALDIEGNEHDYEAGYERNLERSFDDGIE